MDPSVARPLVKPVRGEQADKFADLASFQSDFAGARFALEQMSRHQGSDMLMVFWECAVMRYARVFAKGVRNPLDAASYEAALTESALSTHREILAERDKHIAHSVNGHEHAFAIYQLTDPQSGAPREFLGAGALVFRRAALKARSGAPMLALLDEGEAFLEAVYQAYKSRIDQALEAHGLDALYAVPNLQVRAQSGFDPKARRKR